MKLLVNVSVDYDAVDQLTVGFCTHLIREE
jgi:hypothetical protein